MLNRQATKAGSLPEHREYHQYDPSFAKRERALQYRNRLWGIEVIRRLNNIFIRDECHSMEGRS
jgi:hypothetical protein